MLVEAISVTDSEAAVVFHFQEQVQKKLVHNFSVKSAKPVKYFSVSGIGKHAYIIKYLYENMTLDGSKVRKSYTQEVFFSDTFAEAYDYAEEFKDSTAKIASITLSNYEGFIALTESTEEMPAEEVHNG
ncbi:hypothetical protein [Flexibacter flexilis]|nr:hypothetical protein [Flexibacter flexilis]